jgi:hypothetical protein
MSTATLNVWITEIGDPCHIINPSPQENWYVHILDCDGKVLEWCDRRYRDIRTRCGHAEIEVPPGCYTVMASHSQEGEGVPPFGNRLTHVQIVRVNCGDHACVTLFSPSLWNCGTWFRTALRAQAAGLTEAGVKAETTRAAADAIDDILTQLKPDTFTQNMEALQKGPDN